MAQGEAETGAGHLSDTERVYGFRALALARNDADPLPKLDPDGYVGAAVVRDAHDEQYRR